MFILPVFNKAIDYQESIIFFGLPFFFFLNIIPKLKTLHFSRSYVFAQITLIILFIISTFLSINPGSSYYSLFIFLTVLLIFNLSFVYIQDLELFYKFIVAFSCFYASVFIGSKLHLLTLVTKPDSDNFILQVWGHSYLADLLVFPIIIIISKINKANLKSTLPLIIFLSFSLILTNSRSALVAAVFGLFFLLPKNIYQSLFKYMSFICLILGFIYATIYGGRFKTLTGSRPEYWQQAVLGFQKSPLFGNGPDTFTILNRQSSLNLGGNSRFAHNSILEYLSDNGLIFTSLFFLFILFGLVYQYSRHRLLFCLGLAAFINSLLDPSWSSPGIFIISLIFLFHDNRFLFSSRKNTFYLTNLSVLVFLFFLSKTSSDYFFLQKNYSLSLKFDPFNLNSLLKTPDNPNLLKFYPCEIPTYQALIDQHPLPQSEPYYLKLFKLDPPDNPNYYYSLLNYYVATNQTDKTNNLIALINQNINIHNQPISKTMPLAKLFYLHALNEWQNRQFSLAINHLQIALRFSNGWGQFYFELANAYWHNGQKDRAYSLLKYDCGQNIYSSSACLEYLNEDYGHLFPLGTKGMKQAIENISP